MGKLSCIIVEDEPLAAEILQDYIQQVPFLELKGVCTDALYAMETLQQQHIDVMFLDIHLPKLKGLDFIKALKNPPQVILTTAYREYALDGYELNVVDYLLKPISFNRFVMAVNKLTLPDSADTTNNTTPNERHHLLVNINKKRVKVHTDEILYIESRKDYVNIVTAEQAYLTKLQLTEVADKLDSTLFIRVHRSFIVAVQQVTAYGSMQLEVREHTIPIGRSYKEQVMMVLKNKL